MYMNGQFNVDKWDNKADYLVLDDIDWKFLPNRKQFLGGQYEFELSDKYRSKRTVKWGKPTIYCMNDDNIAEMRKDPMWPWIEGNCITVFIDHRLY